MQLLPVHMVQSRPLVNGQLTGMISVVQIHRRSWRSWAPQFVQVMMKLLARPHSWLFLWSRCRSHCHRPRNARGAARPWRQLTASGGHLTSKQTPLRVLLAGDRLKPRAL